MLSYLFIWRRFELAFQITNFSFQDGSKLGFIISWVKFEEFF